MSSKPATPASAHARSREMVARQLTEAEDSLIVALTYRCNSRCRFCIIEAELHRFADPDRAILGPLFAENGRSRRFSRLILSGAEVTLREDLAAIAHEATTTGGFSVVRIQTNARRLADPDRARALVAAGVREYFISVQAPDAARDAALTRAPASFDEAAAGIANLRAAGATLIANTVVCRDNAAHLPAIAALLLARGFSAAHFWSFLHIGEAGQEAQLVDLAEAIPPLLAAIARLQTAGLPVTTKWFPRCLLGAAAPTLDNHQPQLLIRDEFQDRLSAGFVFDCPHRRSCVHFGRGCDGLHAGYTARFGAPTLFPEAAHG